MRLKVADTHLGRVARGISQTSLLNEPVFTA
jgi:hypothetical protein